MDDRWSAREGQMVLRNRLTRRNALKASAAGVVATLLATNRNPLLSRAQDATPVASPDPDAFPDLSGVSPLPLTGDRLAAFQEFIANTAALLNLPGASVAVVQNGDIAFIEGLGVREAGRPAPVTADTLMRIGSVTKSFSSLLAATLVDAGRLSWETPIVDLLPDFAVSDPEVTARLTASDAFCACTGVPRRDLEFIFRGQDLTPQTMIDSIVDLELTADFGERFQYSNQMVAVGGYAAAVADGGSVRDLNHAYAISLRDQVLNPIGMSRTTMDLTAVVVDDDYATPHAADLAGVPTPLPLLEDDLWLWSAAPAGALWSSAREMARYLQTQLGRGQSPDGVRVVSAANLERTWQPGVSLEVAQFPPPLSGLQGHYGLGWVVGNFAGQRVISHDGGTFGFGALAAFLPDADLGLAVLTNQVDTGPILAYTGLIRLIEIVFDTPSVIGPMIDAVTTGGADVQQEYIARLGEVDLAAVEPFLGDYVNPHLGSLTVAWRGDELIFDTGTVRSALRPFLAEDGAVSHYVLVDPPWAASGTMMAINLVEGAGGQPMVRLTAPASPVDPEITYEYQPVVAFPAATPTG